MVWKFDTRIFMKIMINRGIIVITIAFDEEKQLSTQAKCTLLQIMAKVRRLKTFAQMFVVLAGWIGLLFRNSNQHSGTFSADFTCYWRFNAVQIIWFTLIFHTNSNLYRLGIRSRGFNNSIKFQFILYMHEDNQEDVIVFFLCRFLFAWNFSALFSQLKMNKWWCSSSLSNCLGFLILSFWQLKEFFWKRIHTVRQVSYCCGWCHSKWKVSVAVERIASHVS